jgi:excinuclease ABC subunit C
MGRWGPRYTAAVATTLEEQLKLLPDQPGVYLFRDAAGTILYVGKAVSLRNRVRSYFQAGRGLEAKVQAMVAQVASVEHILVDSEVEALVLESGLIKQHRPKYNIKLRDDKHYPYLRVDARGFWPKLELVRQVRADGARYFGPFPHSSAVWETMHVLRRVFPYRSCSDRRVRTGPDCLYHHIHRCLAPCVAACSEAEYRAMIGEMIDFLDGRAEAVLGRLERRMHAAADELRFEEAAELRDRLAALRTVLERQKVSGAEMAERDVLAMARGHDEAAVQVFFVRRGEVAGRDGFILTGTDGRTDGEVLAAFIEQYYADGPVVPRELLLESPVPEAEAAGLLAMLAARRRGAVRLAVPRRGEKRQLVELVKKNAAEYLAEEQWRRERSREAAQRAAADLRAALGLAEPPHRIECFDISHSQGSLTVGAMAVFEDGAPKKADYRRFRVRTVPGGNDDFLAMQEVLGRRFRRGMRERAEAAAVAEGDVTGAGGFAALPDLLIIDGGRGQLSHARAVLEDLGLEDIPTFGLAKENEWLFAPGRSEPIVLPRTSPGLRLLQRLRDETHRFAVSYHRSLRGKHSVASLLEDAPGIGPARRKALLKAFPSLEAIRAASVEELAAVPGMSRVAAEDLLAYLRAGEDQRPQEG